MPIHSRFFTIFAAVAIVILIPAFYPPSVLPAQARLAGSQSDHIIIQHLGQVQLSDQHPISRILVIGGYAYLSYMDARFEGWGLRIVDISDPSNPKLVGLYNLPHTPGTTGQVWDLAVQGNYAYLAAGSEGLHIIDISDPSKPSQVGVLSNPPINIWDVSLVGTTAYLADRDNGILVVNVADPTQPQVVTSIPLPHITKIQATATRLYADDGGYSTIRVFDRNTYTELGNYRYPTNNDFNDLVDLRIANDVASYTISGCFHYSCSTAFYQTDFANPAAPTLLHSYNPGQNQTYGAFDLNGQFVFAHVNSNNPLTQPAFIQALSLTPLDVNPVGIYTYPSMPYSVTIWSVTLTGDRVLYGTSDGTLVILGFQNYPYATYMPWVTN